MFDQVSDIKINRLFDPVSQAKNTSLTSQVVDRRGFEAVTLVLATGATDTPATLEIQHSDAAGSGFAAVEDKHLVGATEAQVSPAADDDNKVARIGYTGGKRYVRAVATLANSGTSALLAGVAILGRPYDMPVAAQTF